MNKTKLINNLNMIDDVEQLLEEPIEVGENKDENDNKTEKSNDNFFTDKQNENNEEEGEEQIENNNPDDDIKEINENQEQEQIQEEQEIKDNEIKNEENTIDNNENIEKDEIENQIREIENKEEEEKIKDDDEQNGNSKKQEFDDIKEEKKINNDIIINKQNSESEDINKNQKQLNYFYGTKSKIQNQIPHQNINTYFNYNDFKKNHYNYNFSIKNKYYTSNDNNDDKIEYNYVKFLKNQKNNFIDEQNSQNLKNYIDFFEIKNKTKNYCSLLDNSKFKQINLPKKNLKINKDNLINVNKDNKTFQYKPIYTKKGKQVNNEYYFKYNNFFPVNENKFNYQNKKYSECERGFNNRINEMNNIRGKSCGIYLNFDYSNKKPFNLDYYVYKRNYPQYQAKEYY